MLLKNLLPTDFYFYKVTIKEQSDPVFFRIPFTIAQSEEAAEQYITNQSYGKIIERKQRISYQVFVDEYLRPEGLLL